MSQLDQLKPKEIWREFFEICKIPHGSGNIDALRTFLRQRCEAQGFKCSEDDAGNLLVVKEADSGFEKCPTICLQGHLDMVCSKRADSNHDFVRDPIKPQLVTQDGKKVVTATGTTLGADNGIGVAMALAYIFDRGNKSGRIEVLCTKDEETTMSGVKGLATDVLTAKYLINIDSEEVGSITIGSAGGFNSELSFDGLPAEKSKSPCQCVTLAVRHCQGGHSGLDVNKYTANANKLLARIVSRAVEAGGCICTFNGGTAHNAIPMDAKACINFDNLSPDHLDNFLDEARRMGADIAAEYKTTDPKLQVEVTTGCSCEGGCQHLNAKDSRRLVDVLLAQPVGVLRMSPDVEGLTESSVNMGYVRFTAGTGGKVIILTRSSINSFLRTADDAWGALARLAGFPYRGMLDAYGGWAPNPQSPLLKCCKTAYAR